MKNKGKIIINKQVWLMENVTKVIETFIVTDPSFEYYDCGKINQKNWLKDSIHLSNKGMRSRTNNKIFDEKIDLINKIIKDIQISKDSDLLQLNEEEIDKLERLFEEMVVPQVKNAKITKFLHKRFNNLIPIIDKLVGGLYCDDYSKKYCKDIKKLIEIIKRVRVDFIENQDIIGKIKNKLSKEGINNLTKLRIFDIILWMKAKEKNILETSFMKRVKCESLLFKKNRKVIPQKPKPI